MNDNQAMIVKLARKLGNAELAAALVTAGLNSPVVIKDASDGEIEEAVGGENLAAVRAVFPAREQ